MKEKAPEVGTHPPPARGSLTNPGSRRVSCRQDLPGLFLRRFLQLGLQQLQLAVRLALPTDTLRARLDAELEKVRALQTEMALQRGGENIAHLPTALDERLALQRYVPKT